MTQDECYKKLKDKITDKYFSITQSTIYDANCKIKETVYEIFIAPNIRKQGRDLYKLYRSVIASLREKKKKTDKNTLGVNKMNAEEIELTDEEFEDILNELHEPVNICGYTMHKGTILKECDPIAFYQKKLAYESINKKWKCTECDNEFDNKDDADECCKEE